MLNTSGDLTSPSNSLKTQLVSIYNLFANYSGSVPANLVAWAPSSSGGSAAGSGIGTDLGSSILNNWCLVVLLVLKLTMVPLGRRLIPLVVVVRQGFPSSHHRES